MAKKIIDKPLVPHTPTEKIDYDKYGRCAMRHKILLKESMTSDGIVEMFTGEKADMEFLLNDGSRMRVVVCKKCKKDFTDKDFKKLMKSVYKGWYIETQYLKDWSEEKRTNYLTEYANKEIVCNSDKLPNDVLEKKLKEHKEKIIQERIG